MHCPFDSCKYESSRSSNVKRHINTNHNESKDFKYCRNWRAFKPLNHYQHDENKYVTMPWNCDFCKISFTLKSVYLPRICKIHEKKHYLKISRSKHFR